MLRAFEPVSDWSTPYEPDVVTAGCLGIAEGSLIDLKAALEKDKDLL
jgi:hypothetical protein